jgi:hypothetical protein
MNFVKNCAFSVSVFALAIGLTTSQANAQSLKGTFNLPYQAHWGNVVLEPGQYALSLSTGTLTTPVIYITGQGKTVMILAARPATAESERGYLRIENVGQTHVIREFNSGIAGRLFTFSVPKSVKNQIAVASNAPDTTVAVASSGGN